MTGLRSYFLPYQWAWLEDCSRLKIWEKSRRIGATYVQAYEDVCDASCAEGACDVWFSSADEAAGREYIRYALQWAELLNVAARDLGEVAYDEERTLRGKAIEFCTGKRVVALSSSPTAFRSKGGKVVIDEYAFHKDPDELWRAAAPVAIRGHKIRVLSTYNGTGNRYWRMVDEARKGVGDVVGWSLHTTTIEAALRQGLLESILQRAVSEDERAAFLQECRDIAGDEDTFQQEFMCQPVDAATAWLTWELITGCESDAAGDPEQFAGGEVYVGMDIGRRRDLTVIWVLEKVGDVYLTREVVQMRKAAFSSQHAALDEIVARYRPRRVCIDQTGMGEAFVEAAQERHGRYLIEGVLMSGAVKQDLATVLKQRFEDRRCRIPATTAIRNAHHAVRKTVTAAGNPRFDADRSEVGHADEFWAHALAHHACGVGAAPAGVTVSFDDTDIYNDKSHVMGDRYAF